jgi:hypothetical protein
MSLTVNHSDKIFNPQGAGMSYNFKKKLDSYSGYIRAISEELDLDNKYSQNLKKNLFRATFGFLIVLLTIFGWRKLIDVLIESQVSGIVIMTGYLTALSIIAISLFYVIFNAGKVVRTLSEIFANATNTRSIVQSRVVVIKTFFALILIGIALLFPFIMFMVNLKTIYVIIPFALMIIAGWQLYTVSPGKSVKSNESFISNKKFEYNTKMRHEWKM